MARVVPLPEESIVQPVETDQKKMKIMIGGVYGLLALLGIGTGYLLSQKIPIAQKPGFINTGKVVGTTDSKTFRDSAEGTIEKDGIEGEGTHKLIREGGPSQTAYLTSSLINLDDYVGKKVKVYGETFAAEKVSWLMDVGKIELLE
ncbi:MAG: hypothetical protein ACD_36C00013G0006 [uncultured bacterium]|uniref:Uncharacterized protein n=1 Tax=Candidatus Gottesmanbacteria bacterium RIFCSPLOWO2_01_FULL_43_11b TaxID=1798392 RepID=A0A1F6AI23_9BACT|nr:MAG: hypothetical protein ACD_36C00013G0006 [uncultured bacterium]OGG24388.1 MAG: hypothetical protein A3A79_04355 [Candidatus Gottesmanbacteria bacterium RIFCSPLOWO2_01_FULL_43_11b]